jgi:hypothetical protein
MMSENEHEMLTKLVRAQSCFDDVVDGHTRIDRASQNKKLMSAQIELPTNDGCLY